MLCMTCFVVTFSVIFIIVVVVVIIIIISSFVTHLIRPVILG